MSLRVRPCTLAQANEYIARLHRHHKPVQGHRFSISAWDGDTLVGVCVVGRPVSASVDAYFTAEVTRLCTDGSRNACSLLYSAAARACEAMGYDRIQTYTLPEEGGASLRACAWVLEGQSSGSSWNTSKRARNADLDGAVKSRWARVFMKGARK